MPDDFSYANNPAKGPVRIKLTFLITGKEVEFEFDHCHFEQMRGIKKYYGEFGDCINIGPDGRERLSLKMWKGMEKYEDLDPDYAKVSDIMTKRYDMPSIGCKCESSKCALCDEEEDA